MHELVLVGDIHGDFYVLNEVCKKTPKDIPIIQVGDFGFWPVLKDQYLKSNIDRPIFFIDGNHDFMPGYAGIETPKEVWPNAVFVPRGTVLTLNGIRIAFCGGTTSVDRKFRAKGGLGGGWFPEEDVMANDVNKLMQVDFDLLVTHCPPESVILRHFDRDGLKLWDLPPDWPDPSAKQIDRLWHMRGKPPLISGHMHRHIEDQTCTILDINEIMVWKKS